VLFEKRFSELVGEDTDHGVELNLVNVESHKLTLAPTTGMALTNKQHQQQAWHLGDLYVPELNINEMPLPLLFSLSAFLKKIQKQV